MINYLKNILHRLALSSYYLYQRVKCKFLGLYFVPPNYAFFNNLLYGGVAIDVGVGDNPDFTLFIINKYNIESFMVDPTHKHMDKLREFEKQNSLVHYLPLALGAKNEEKMFYESQSNVSGSLRKDHINIQNDSLIAYNVQVITLNKLLQLCNNKSIAVMKIDIEGEEYEFVKSVTKNELHRIRQFIIEFHHGIIKNYSIEDTLQAIKVIEDQGMKSIIYNGRDCLFYWE